MMNTYSTDILKPISNKLFRISSDILEKYSSREICSNIVDTYGINVNQGTYPSECLGVLNSSLDKLPQGLIRDCGITSLDFKDLGPSKEYYPNHGIYHNGTLTLNFRIIDDPMIISDPINGKKFNRFDQILYHELGHGWDEIKGNGKDLSLEDDWLSLSGWSETPKKGLKRIRIRERGTPELVGEYYYSPDAGFTRYYAKRNPWDDWADSFAYYVAGLKGFLPENKINYFDEKLKSYY